jgi:hypothetical protein
VSGLAEEERRSRGMGRERDELLPAAVAARDTAPAAHGQCTAAGHLLPHSMLSSAMLPPADALSAQLHSQVQIPAPVRAV